MKRVLLVLVLMLSLVGCSTSPEVEQEDSIKIGVLQLLTHPALDSAYEGFVDYLNEQGIELLEGENLIYENPQADQANLVTMAESLINNNCDLILAIATSPAQVLKNVNIDTPIVGTAITDFVDASIVDSNEVPGGYITGVSDNCDMNAQFNLIKEVVPSIQTLGIIYTSSETNSEIQANQLTKVCEDNGVKVEILTVSDSDKINDTMIALVNKNVDAIYIPTDNTIASAMASVTIVAEEYKVPLINAEKGQVEEGGLVSLGCDYYELGKQAGAMAFRILNGADPATMPIEFQETMTIYYNSKSAEKMGVTLPERILKEGIDVAK